MSTTATPPAAAAPTTEPAAAPKKSVSKDLLKRMARGTPDEEAAATPPPAAPAATTEAAPPAAPAAGTPAAPAAPAAAEATPRVKRKATDLPPIPAAAGATPPSIAEVVRQTLAEAPATTTTAPAPKLNADEERDLELARFAATKLPDKYKDLPDQIIAFPAVRDAFLAGKATELGGRGSPEFRDYVQSDEFKSWLRENQPSYQRGDRQRLYEEHLMDKGSKQTLAQIKPEIEAVRLQTLAVQQEPIINQTINEAVEILLNDPAPEKDEALVAFSADPKGFINENEIEARIILDTGELFKERARETLRITSGLVDLSKVEKATETQQWIDGFVTKLETGIEAKFPNGMPTFDNKILVSTGQFARLQAAKAPNLDQYRRILPREIVGAMATEHQANMKAALKAERDRLARAGFVRVKKTAPAAQVVPPVVPAAAPSPLASSAPAPGIAAKTPASTQPWHAKYAETK